MKKIIMAGVASILASPAFAEQSLEQAASDPTASLMSFQLSDWRSYQYHDSTTDDNTVVFRAALPYKVDEQKHILRVTLPFITDHPQLKSGLSDATIFDLAAFDQRWGRFGVGLVAALPTGGADSGAEKWGLGPALGFVAQEKTFIWGLFNQNVFTVAGSDARRDLNVSSLQPIFNRKIGNGWSASLSEMQISYDWTDRRWSNLPLGAGISKLQKLDNVPVQFNMQYEHNFADDRIAPSDTIRVSAKVLLPAL